MGLRGLLIIFLFVFLGSDVNAQTFWRRDTICKNTQINYSFILRKGTTPPSLWEWSMPGGNPSSKTSPTDSTTGFFSYPDSGTYTITVKMSFPDGSDSSFYAILTVFDPAPPANSLGNDTTYCGNFSRVLNAGNTGSSYVWSTGANTQQITVTQPGTYSVQISNRCYSGTFSIVLNRTAAPRVDLGPDGFVCNDAPRTLNAGNDGVTYLWSTGETSNTIEVNSAGTYSVLVTNNGGCTATDELILRDSCPPDLFIPNAFTPNADRINDSLKPYINGIASYTFTIYDRWGELLFTTQDVLQPWDGNFNGAPCPTGIYAWTISALDNNGNRIHKNGTFLLYR